jgi:protein tyrosine phosphatase
MSITFLPSTRIDHLIGIARPGYLAENSKKSETAIREEIETTLNTLFDMGVRKIISLSDREAHIDKDPIIEELWRAKLGVSKKVKIFTHIHNEDTFGNPYFRIGQGPTLRKIEQFIKETKPIGDSLIAVYCCGGKGRTCTYLTSYIISTYQKDGEAAFEYLIEASGNRSSKLIRDEMSLNGGFIALEELYEKIPKP